MPRLRFLLIAALLLVACASFADDINLCTWCTSTPPVVTAQPVTPIIFSFPSGTQPGVSPNPYPTYSSYGITVNGGGSQIVYNNLGVTVTGYYWNGQTWVTGTNSGLSLTGRNDIGQGNSVQDHGIGVCSPGETCNGSSEEANELSNQQNYELLQISLTSGQTGAWTGVDLSSLDKGGNGIYITGQVFASDDAPNSVFRPDGTGGFASPTAGSPNNSFICTFYYDATTGYPGNPALNNGCKTNPTPATAVPGLTSYDADVIFNKTQSTKYIYIWAYNPYSDPTSPGYDPQYLTGPQSSGRDNDFLLYGVQGTIPTIPGNPVPEPASLMLLGSGLAGVGVSLRRKLRK
jgi:hypothetical protein